jgi:hypothetical protein
MKVIGIIVTGMFAVIGVLVLAFLVSLSHQSTDARKASDVPLFQMNQQFSVGYWTYRVNSVGNQPWLPDLGQLKACDSGNCVVVNLTVRNDDKTSSTRPVVELVDNSGREFSETDTWTDTQLSQLQQLNPGVGKRGVIYFDAPRGSYRLKVSGGYTSGVDALVNLTPAEAPAEANSLPMAAPRYEQPVQNDTPPSQAPAEEPNYEQPSVQNVPSAQASVESPPSSALPPTEAVKVPSDAPAVATSSSATPSDLLTVTVTETKVVQHIDAQGHAMLLASAYRKSAPDERFSLICHTAKSSCTRLREGQDYNARILQPGDPYYTYGDLKNAVIVRIDFGVFALMREKKVANQ